METNPFEAARIDHSESDDKPRTADQTDEPAIPNEENCFPVAFACGLPGEVKTAIYKYLERGLPPGMER